MSVEFRSIPAAAVAAAVDEVVALHPDLLRLAEALPADAPRDGFTLVLAYAYGRLAGVAYGWAVPAGRWFSTAEAPPGAAILDVDKFAVIEWFVRPELRGRGIGRSLLSRLLGSRREPWAVVAADARSRARYALLPLDTGEPPAG
jgi:GNAT superfamily N-acetyltransferase